jgi:hypothetical protein
VVSWATDALWLGPLIQTHLQTQVTEFRQVYLADELDLEAKEPPQVPSAVVMLSDLRPLDTSPQQRAGTVEQDWLLMLCVRSARRDQDRARQKLGALISKTVRAMQGWAPSDRQRAFEWRRGPRPDYTANTSFFPLLFTTMVVAR